MRVPGRRAASSHVPHPYLARKAAKDRSVHARTDAHTRTRPRGFGGYSADHRFFSQHRRQRCDGGGQAEVQCRRCEIYGLDVSTCWLQSSLIHREVKLMHAYRLVLLSKSKRRWERHVSLILRRLEEYVPSTLLFKMLTKASDP